MENKRAAIELSMTTIVVVVLSLTLLIMGFVLVRSIMCGAIGMTEEINAKVRSQINSFFESSSSGDFTCIGGGDPVTMVAGKANYIFCSVNADEQKKYKFDISYNEGFSKIPQSVAYDWLSSREDVEKEFNPNEREPQKIFLLNIPKTAQTGAMAFDIEVSAKEGASWNRVGSQVLSYNVDQVGAIKGFLC